MLHWTTSPSWNGETWHARILDVDVDVDQKKARREEGDKKLEAKVWKLEH